MYETSVRLFFRPGDVQDNKMQLYVAGMASLHTMDSDSLAALATATGRTEQAAVRSTRAPHLVPAWGCCTRSRRFVFGFFLFCVHLVGCVHCRFAARRGGAPRRLVFLFVCTAVCAVHADTVSALFALCARPQARRERAHTMRGLTCCVPCSQVLRKRADTMRGLIASNLWDDELSIFVNRLPNGTFLRRISPTSFYPLIVKARTPTVE